MLRYAKKVRLADLTPTLAPSGSNLLSQALDGSLWLLLDLSVSLSGSLLLSNFTYTALDRLTGPLLGSHCRCHDDALSPALILDNKSLSS